MIVLAAFATLPACKEETAATVASTDGLDELARAMLDATASDSPGAFYTSSFSAMGKNDLAKEDWLSLADAYRRRFGEVVSIEPLDVTASALGGATHGSGLYQVTWKNGQGTLKINCTRTGGQWKINSYVIASPQIRPATEPARTQPVTTQPV